MALLKWLFRLTDLALLPYFALTFEPLWAGAAVGLILAGRSIKDLSAPPDKTLAAGKLEVPWRQYADKFYDYLAIGAAAYLILWVPGLLSYALGASLLLRQIIGLGAPGGDATWIFPARPPRMGSLWSMLLNGFRYVLSLLRAIGTGLYLTRRKRRARRPAVSARADRRQMTDRRQGARWRLDRDTDRVRISKGRVFR